MNKVMSPQQYLFLPGCLAVKKIYKSEHASHSSCFSIFLINPPIFNTILNHFVSTKTTFFKIMARYLVDIALLTLSICHKNVFLLKKFASGTYNVKILGRNIFKIWVRLRPKNQSVFLARICWTYVEIIIEFRVKI